MTVPEITALRTGGGLVTIRPATAADEAALRSMVTLASDRSIRSRFFTVSRGVAERYTDTIVAEPQSDDRDSIVALVDRAVVGLAVLEQLSDDSAEIAVLIADSVQQQGIGTLLVEELLASARNRRLSTLTADVLSDNTIMLSVLSDLGLSMTRVLQNGVVQIVIDLGASADMADHVTERELASEFASLHDAVAPRSVAIVGVGSREHSVGRSILRNLLSAGYRGDLAIVHPHHHKILGIRAVASVGELHSVPDLAIVSVPAPLVAGVVEDLGKIGTRAALVVTSGFGETGVDGARAEAELLASARTYGMRLIGPNCLGIVNTDPDVRLNATFAPIPIDDGGLGLASQSGAVGIAVAQAAERRGLGLAQFVSMGNKVDVSGNDLLLLWATEERVRTIALYLESVGNPRKFARVARYVSETKPILALKSGRTSAGRSAGRSHTAAAAAAEPVVRALFDQAGVQRLDTLEELLDAASVLDRQPLPKGSRVAIVGNSGGPEILAADTAGHLGLAVPTLSEPLQETLRAIAPDAASAANPVDLGATVQPGQLETVLRRLMDSNEVDAIVTVFAETMAVAQPKVRAAIVRAAHAATITLVATEVGAECGVIDVPGSDRTVPVFGFPERAVHAVAVAARAGAVMARSSEPPLMPPGLSLRAVRESVTEALTDGPRWLEPDVAARLLAACGVPVARQDLVRTLSEARSAARRFGYPVVLKRAAGVHKSDEHGVIVDIRSDTELRHAVRDLGGDELLIQPLYTDGVELIVGGLQDPQFGPLVMAGPGGVLTDIAEHTLRLAPLQHSDLDAMLATPVMSRLMSGFRGFPPVDEAAVRDLIARVAWLVDHFPEVAEIDLNPVICQADRLVTVDAKIRVTAFTAAEDPLSRALNHRARRTPITSAR